MDTSTSRATNPAAELENLFATLNSLISGIGVAVLVALVVGVAAMAFRILSATAPSRRKR